MSPEHDACGVGFVAHIKGVKSHSIIEQGQIDRILSTKPEERRFIFDEAAGINKFKSRQQEAERKLEQTAANLEQASLIMKDVREGSTLRLVKTLRSIFLILRISQAPAR